MPQNHVIKFLESMFHFCINVLISTEEMDMFGYFNEVLQTCFSVIYAITCGQRGQRKVFIKAGEYSLTHCEFELTEQTDINTFLLSFYIYDQKKSKNFPKSKKMTDKTKEM